MVVLVVRFCCTGAWLAFGSEHLSMLLFIIAIDTQLLTIGELHGRTEDIIHPLEMALASIQYKVEISIVDLHRTVPLIVQYRRLFQRLIRSDQRTLFACETSSEVRDKGARSSSGSRASPLLLFSANHFAILHTGYL